MKRKFTWLVSLLSLLVLGFVLGCGGSGSGGSSGSGTDVFIQDDMNTNYSHVWVTIDQVSIVKNGSTQVLFDGTANGGTGKVVDLLSLHGTGAPLFLMLGQAAPVGPFQSVSVTVASSLSVVPTGSTTPIAATFQGATGSTFTMSLTLPTGPVGPGGQAPIPNGLLVDFDLANWNLNGTTVSATNNQFLSPGTWTGFGSPGNQVPNDFLGAISDLTGTAPNQTFTLTGPFAVTVQTTASTVIFNADGTVSASLSAAENSGEMAMVSGSFDASTKTLTATSIRLVPATALPLAPAVGGVVQSDSASNGTITIQVASSDNWLPITMNLTIDVTSNTSLIDGSGVTDTPAEFFAALTAGTTRIFATGPISNGVMQATMVGISMPLGSIGSGGQGGEVVLMGSPTNINATAGTFDLTVGAWEGKFTGPATTIHVTTGSGTTFNNNQSETSFFQSLTQTTKVAVRGNLTPSTDTVSAVAVESGQILGSSGSGHISI